MHTIANLARRTARRAKQLLRGLVVWSARPPLASVYRQLYRQLTGWAVSRLRRHECVRAIYLCRGCAADAITPGVSDIDLVVITRAAASAQELAAVRQTFARLGRRSLRLIDAYPKLVLSQQTLAHRWRTAPAWQYRYVEGLQSWRLLAGSDLLAQLPPFPQAAWPLACFLELARWWLLFADLILATREHRSDRILWNATCYKAVSECLRVREALDRGQIISSRAQALADLDSPLGRRLRALAAARFARDDPGIADACLTFLLEFFVQLEARDPPVLEADPAMRQRLAPSARPRPLSGQARAQLDRIRGEVAERWGAPAPRLLSSAFWPQDHRLLVVEPPPGTPLRVRDCVALVQRHHSLQTPGQPPVHLFLRRGRVLFPLTPTLPADLHRGLPTPASMPDIFLQLGEQPVSWTRFCAWYLCAWRDNEQWPQASASQRQQLEAIRHGAERGCVVYPGPADGGGLGSAS